MKALMALVAVLLAACSGGPTAPEPPGPQQPGPDIAVFVAESYINPYGEVKLRLAFVAGRVPSDSTTLRLGTGPQSSDVLVYHTPAGDYGPEWRWVAWGADGTARYDRYFPWPAVRTTYTLDVSTPHGSASRSRTVEPL